MITGEPFTDKLIFIARFLYEIYEIIYKQFGNIYRHNYINLDFKQQSVQFKPYAQGKPGCKYFTHI